MQHRKFHGSIFTILCFFPVFTLLYSCCSLTPPLEHQVQEEQVYKEILPRGEIYYSQMSSAPFPHPERREGATLQGVYYPYHPHYSNSAVGIFVPAGFKPKKRVDLVFYFHGNFETIGTAPLKFELYRQFAESGVNALLVMPETAANCPDNFGGKLEEQKGFQRLVEDIYGYIHRSGIVESPRLGSIVLTAHSGGHHVIARILEQGNLRWFVREVMIFDGLYGELETFAGWPGLINSRLSVIYQKNGTTHENTVRFLQLMDRSLWRVSAITDDPGIDFSRYRTKVLVIDSEHDHYGVQFEADQFRRLLESSRVLRKRSKR